GKELEGVPWPASVIVGRSVGRAPAEPEVDVLEELRLGVDAVEARDVTAEAVVEDVLVSPEDALRHAGGPAGVENVEVVVRVGQVERVRGRRREQLLVVDRAGQQRL